jgi:hypothetical protein
MYTQTRGQLRLSSQTLTFMSHTQFQDGALYRFFAVPATCFQELLRSESKGRYFNANIRNRFRFQRVADPRLNETEEN